MVCERLPETEAVGKNCAGTVKARLKQHTTSTHPCYRYMYCTRHYQLMGWQKSVQNITISDQQITISDQQITISDQQITISDQQITISDQQISISDHQIRTFEK
jgi:hypothetical protein